jgi:hypothetical protein
MISRDDVLSVIKPLNPCTDLKTVPKVLRNVVHPLSGSLEETSAEATPETIRIR